MDVLCLIGVSTTCRVGLSIPEVAAAVHFCFIDLVRLMYRQVQRGDAVASVYAHRLVGIAAA